MRNLLNFLARYNNLIIFLILEGITIYLLATGNIYHNARIVKAIKGMTYGIEQRISNTRTYLSLRQINSKLADENVALRNTLGSTIRKEDLQFSSITDTIYNQQYQYSSAEVINNSVNRQKNFFTINKGSNQGIGVDMAVNSTFGIAGIIVGCSDNYSVAMSVINQDFKLSARIRSNGYFGSLSWDGRDYRKAILSEIPQHVTVNAGDTIETTGFSAIFPEGILIGTISDFEKVGGDFLKIYVSLATDFKRLNYVDVIGNYKKKEQTDLEKLFQ